MDNNILAIFAVLKVVKLALSYGSLAIATNYTSQIYTEKVYVRQENPPTLANMLLLFLGIEVLMTVVVVTAIVLLINYASGGDDSTMLMSVGTLFAQDYVFYLISMVIHGMVLANIMYSKKYFLYKDDGLRAIRAYSAVLLQYSLFNGVIPFNYFVEGVISAAGSMAQTKEQ